MGVEVLPLLYSYKSVVKILISHLCITDMPKESKEPKKSKRKGGRKGITYKDKALPYEHVLVKAPKGKRSEKPVYTTRVGEQRPLTRDELRQQELIQARAIQGQQALQGQQRQDALIGLQMEYLKQKIKPQEFPAQIKVNGEVYERPDFETYINAEVKYNRDKPVLDQLEKEAKALRKEFKEKLNRGEDVDEIKVALIEKGKQVYALESEMNKAAEILRQGEAFRNARQLTKLQKEKENIDLGIEEVQELIKEEEERTKSVSYPRVVRMMTEAEMKVREAFSQTVDPFLPKEKQLIQKKQIEQQRMEAEDKLARLWRQEEKLLKKKQMSLGEEYVPPPLEETRTNLFENVDVEGNESLFPTFSLGKPAFERPETKPIGSYGGGGGEPGTRRKRREKEIPLSFEPEIVPPLPLEAVKSYVAPPPAINLNPLQLPPETPYVFEPPAPPPPPVRIRKEKTPLPISFQPEPIAPIVPEQAMVPYSPPVTELVAREVRKPYKWTGKRGIGPLSEVLPEYKMVKEFTPTSSTELILPYDTDLSGLLGKRETLRSVRKQGTKSNKSSKLVPEEEVTAPAPLMLTEPPPPNPFAPLPPFTSSTALYAQPSPEWINFASQSSYSDIPVWTPGASVGESFKYKALFDI